MKVEDSKKSRAVKLRKEREQRSQVAQRPGKKLGSK